MKKKIILVGNEHDVIDIIDNNKNYYDEFIIQNDKMFENIYYKYIFSLELHQ